MSRIALNFFSLERQDFPLNILRMPYSQSQELADDPEVSYRKLPSEKEKYEQYWVALDEHREGFELFKCTPHTNRYLTLDCLFQAVCVQAKKALNHTQYRIERGFRRQIFISLASHPEGEEEVWLEPFYLHAVERFGFLADFRFTPTPEHRGTRRAQQLSLSLDRHFQANKNYYVDRFEKLQAFVDSFHEKLFRLSVGTTEVQVSSRLTTLTPFSLEKKTYVFSDTRSSASQFMGIKRHGPLDAVHDRGTLFFLFRKQDKPLADDLYRALRGDSFRTFPGFEDMFRLHLNGSNVSGATLDSFSKDDLNAAAERVIQHSEGRPVVPIIVTPFSSHDDEKNNKIYWFLKHAFLKRGMATQVVSTDTLSNRNALKWSASNIGLQVFAKLGGIPWKVAPRTKPCLIVGIGQSHRRIDDRIDRYFAYSVLTDSSGVYEEARVLGESHDEDEYLAQFMERLKAVFINYAPKFTSFAVHATFAIRKRELEAIRAVIYDVAPELGDDKEFVAMKFNDRNKYFGYASSHNSLVPHESAVVKLSKNEYLVWFEGLQYNNPSVTKRYGRPVHVRFDYPLDGLSKERKRDYLQDAVNLSGANWRGFNAKSLPVSVYYAQLIAKYIGRFQELGLEDVDLTELSPWFL